MSIFLPWFFSFFTWFLFYFFFFLKRPLGRSTLQRSQFGGIFGIWVKRKGPMRSLSLVSFCSYANAFVIHVWRSLSGQSPWIFVFMLFYPNISAMREMRRERWRRDKGRIHDTDTETDTQRDEEKDRGKDRERERLRRRLINTCTCTLKLLPCTYNYSRAITSLHKGRKRPPNKP